MAIFSARPIKDLRPLYIYILDIWLSPHECGDDDIELKIINIFLILTVYRTTRITKSKISHFSI